MKPMVRSRSTVMRSTRDTPGRRLSFISLSLAASAARHRLVGSGKCPRFDAQSIPCGEEKADEIPTYRVGSPCVPRLRACGGGGAGPDGGLSQPDDQVRGALS